MKMRLTLTLALMMTTIWLTSSYECPTDKFIPCTKGGDHAECTIPEDVTQGFVSYGDKDYYLLIPFSNDGGKSMTIGCNDHLGDPQVGQTKYCCYVETDNGFDSSGFSKMTDGSRKDRSGPLTIRYGGEGQYFYRSFLGKSFVECSIDLLGDPRSGKSKSCESKNSVPAMLSDESDSFLTCTGEGTNVPCKGLSAFSVHWIRYEGENNNRAIWTLTLSKSGEFPCQDRNFHDPDPGSSKYCSKSKPLVQFEDLVGEWVVGQECGGGCQHGFSISIGFTEVDTKTVTDEWTKTFQGSVSAGFTFKKAGGSAEMGGSVSHSVSTQLETSLKVEEKVETHVDCDRAVLWRWKIDATRSNLYGRQAMKLLSDIYWCGDSDKPPQCPPQFCEDQVDCSTCHDLTGKSEL